MQLKCSVMFFDVSIHRVSRPQQRSVTSVTQFLNCELKFEWMVIKLNACRQTSKCCFLFIKNLYATSSKNSQRFQIKFFILNFCNFPKSRPQHTIFQFLTMMIMIELNYVSTTVSTCLRLNAKNIMIKLFTLA